MGVIMHNNIPYGGGSTIEPNPQESATEQLETLGIDGDVYEVTDANAIHTSDVGVANGIAELDSNGKVPSSQLPSFVDDVVEGYYDSNTDRFYEESTFTTVIPPTDGKSWVDVLTNKSYRWTGSVYVRVDEGVQLGETSSTAYRGDRGKIAYEHSQSDHSGIKPAFTEASTRANIASGETIATIFGKIKKFFSDLKTVAFTGAYSDLSGTPTIPTVNDATLTIQKNGTAVETFTANSSTNKTANITVPTKTSDLTNDSGFVTTDEKVTGEVKNPTASTTYNVPFVNGTTNQKPFINDGLNFNTYAGTTSATGRSQLKVGNNIETGTAGNKYGELLLYSEKSGFARIKASANSTADRTITFQDKTGTVALTSDLSSYLPLTGGTLTGNLNVSNNGASDTALYVRGNSTGAYIGFHNANGGTTYGYYGVKNDNKPYFYSGTGKRIVLADELPTVNNGTLTIQKNGTQVQTFTANQSSNATANITVPTKVSELTNDSGYTTNTGTVTQVKVGTTAYNPSSGVISLPAYPSDTNTHRPIQMNGTEILGNNTTALNLKAGSNVTLTNSSGTVTIAATDTNTDTKNTAGSTNSTDVLFLVGATSQTTYSTTYSNVNCYASSGRLYSNGKQVVNLSDSQALTNKTYNGYTLADACAKAVQNSSSATALTASSLPTGQTIAAYIKNNFMKALWEGTVNSAKTQNYTTSAGDNTRFLLVKYDVTNAGVLYQLMKVGDATCLSLFAKGSSSYPITVYQRDISVAKTSFTTGAGYVCRYNSYSAGEYLRILGVYAIFYGA